LYIVNRSDRHDAPLVISMAVLSVPKIVTPRFATIVGLTDVVCRTHLTDEHAALARSSRRPLRESGRRRSCEVTVTRGRVG
jgi:hypothetical protein